MDFPPARDDAAAAPPEVALVVVAARPAVDLADGDGPAQLRVVRHAELHRAEAVVACAVAAREELDHQIIDLPRESA